MAVLNGPSPLGYGWQASRDDLKLACQPKLSEGKRRLVGETGFEPATLAPKADALPGCATPRPSAKRRPNSGGGARKALLLGGLGFVAAPT